MLATSSPLELTPPTSWSTTRKSVSALGQLLWAMDGNSGISRLDEMEEVRVRGLRIERDLYFSPTKLHQIEELEELVQGHFTKEALQAEENPTEELDKGHRILSNEEIAPEGVPALNPVSSV